MHMNCPVYACKLAFGLILKYALRRLTVKSLVIHVQYCEYASEHHMLFLYFSVLEKK